MHDICFDKDILRSLGWISIHRELQFHKIWTSEKFTKGQAWVDLLMLAKHKPSMTFIHGHRVDIEIGEVALAKDLLAKRWRWSRQKVVNFLKLLKKEQQIEFRKTASVVVVKLVNYEKYQQKKQQTSQQKSNRKATEKQQKIIYNNINNNKKNKTTSLFLKKENPTLDEISDFCKTQKFKTDPEKFFNYYEANGWKVGANAMKDWKAALRYWEKKEKKQEISTTDLSLKTRQDKLKVEMKKIVEKMKFYVNNHFGNGEASRFNDFLLKSKLEKSSVGWVFTYAKLENSKDYGTFLQSFKQDLGVEFQEMN